MFNYTYNNMEFNRIKNILFVAFLLFVAVKGSAQITIEKPTFPFTQICANASFNSFEVTFKFSPESSFTATNQFIVEMSDPSGSFSGTPLAVYTSAAGAVTTSPKMISFSVPKTIAGEKFKLRVRSTSPALTSPESNAFAAYYKLQDTPFSINNFVSTATYCVGGSFVLTIDNPGTGLNDSPLKHPTLTYKWFKETSPTTSDFVAAGPTLAVNKPGTYYVETNYGSCSSDSYSNRVTVTESLSASIATITSSLGNPYCPSEGPTVLTANSGVSYQWSKNNVVIAGATNQTYTTNEIGDFSVAVNNGSCSVNASINLKQMESFVSTINVPASNSIIRDQTLAVTAKTTATNPTYKWYLDDVLLTNITTATYLVKTAGNYKVAITQSTGCVATKEHLFTVTLDDTKVDFQDVANIPNVISPNGDGINDTWQIPLEYINANKAEIIVLNGIGETVLKTNNYQNNWPDGPLDFKNVNPVYYYIITTMDGKVKKGSITVVK